MGHRPVGDPNRETLKGGGIEDIRVFLIIDFRICEKVSIVSVRDFACDLLPFITSVSLEDS